MALDLDYHHQGTDFCVLYFRGLQLTSPPWKNTRASDKHTKLAGSAAGTGFMSKQIGSTQKI
jgi:hypothetical protein